MYIIFISLTKICSSSLGDNTIAYERCIKKCYTQFSCPKLENAYKWSTKDCFECRYECIWEVANIFKSYGKEIPQFHGKWPFTAIHFEIPILKIFFLIQEPASVLFSILNLLSCFYLYKYIKKNIDSMDPLKNVWLLYGIIGIIAWILSSIFHSFDTWQTELLDYSGAFMVVLFQFYGAVSFQFSKIIQKNKNVKLLWQLMSFCALLFAIDHLYKLVYLRNYGYNMKVCLTVSALTITLYIYWIIKSLNTKSYAILKARKYLISILLFVGIGILFEIFDFPPIYNIFDAHSIFHLFTIPIPILLSRFIVCVSESRQYIYKDSKDI
ncbi:Post-GPI attachment to proteins factor 3 [Strongyloides ratti]|uniref:Post-GPI attachment to proteins factor 3 n=1 Tax=Strongyloides ratti TaxID=34506 RepID=A0A090L7I4_STRRB|nr:Post-GPI attachment to proteins factor 3 [Strongyloides ratti]CEF63489.1 Post-GPI attachment to proteins factor 3 [Strongyloides ratti]